MFQMFEGTLQLIIPELVVLETFQFFQKLSDRHVEATVVWFGQFYGLKMHIIEAYMPLQYNTELSFYIPADEVHRMNLHAYNSGLMLMAQLHTHPGEAFHSSHDDSGSILVFDGQFSIVIPDYGNIDPLRLPLWAVYRKENDMWVYVPTKEVETIFQIV